MNIYDSKRRFNDWFIPYARATLADWRARHPLIRVVEPLPIDEQTEQANQAALNISLQEQWNRDVCLYLTTGRLG